MQDISLEQARYWLACEARHMDFAKENGRFWLACEARHMDFAKDNGRFWVEPDQVKAWATVTAAAIRKVLRAAGLSDDWHLNQDAEGADPANTDAFMVRER